MRKLIIVAALAVASGFTLPSFEAGAKTRVVNLNVTVGALRATCSSVGGTFGVHPDGGGYGCVKANCDGKGGKCQVQCDNNNNCTGTSPARTTNNEYGIMAVFGNYATGGNAGTSGSAAPGGSILDSAPGMGAAAPSATGRPVDAPKTPAPAPIQIR
jgi:hypothetical protein